MPTSTFSQGKKKKADLDTILIRKKLYMTIIITDVLVVSTELALLCYVASLSQDLYCTPRQSPPVSPCLPLDMTMSSEIILSSCRLPLHPTRKEVQPSCREPICPCPMETILLLSPIIASSYDIILKKLLLSWLDCTKFWISQWGRLLLFIQVHYSSLS